MSSLLSGSHPILTCADAKAWEANVLRDEAAEWAAMQRAGAAIAREVVEDYREIGGFPDNARILVLAGKGHNGGDALLAAGELLRRFPHATADVVFAFGESELRPLAAKAWGLLRGMDRVRGMGLPTHASGRRIQSMGLETHATGETHAAGEAHATSWSAATYDLCLDGVFGMQFRLPLDEKIAELLARINTHPRIRLRAAIDLPSGLGEKNAGTVFRADFTYATGIVKAPAILPANAPFVGRLRYFDLGFFGSDCRIPLAGDASAQSPASGLLQDPEGTTARVLLPSLLAPLAAFRPSQSDKRTYGHLLVLGGSLSYPGAVVLAVRAALRSGVGLVTAFVPEPLVAEYAARHPEAMWVGCPVNASGALTHEALPRIRERLTRASALLLGPGLGADAAALALAEALVRVAGVPLVLDADALRPEIVRAALGQVFIATPHAGERERIAPAFDRDDMLWPPDGFIVEKGPLTRILGHWFGPGNPGKRPLRDTPPAFFHSPYGGPVLARGGSGDVLAGLIGGLLAQAPAGPLLAACRGVVWHGRAADLLARTRGQVAVELSEILEHLGPALSTAPCPPPSP